MKKSEDVQLPLFSNAEFSSSIPSRATSKQENDFIVIIRNEIQNFVKNGGDYSKPIVLNIDLKKIASERGLSRWEPLQRSFKKTIDTIKQYPLNQTIQYLDEDDNLRERTYWMLSYIDENPKQGVIQIVVDKNFQEYYVNELLRHPEIQMDIKFHESCTSSYTYPFVNWLSAEVAEMRHKDAPYPYHITISLEELQQRVPPLATRKKGKTMRPTEYRRNAIEKAIADINANPYSQLFIENADDIVSGRERRAISAFTFIVSLKARTPENHVPLLVGEDTQGLIDDASIPPWEYLRDRMLALGYGPSSVDRWRDKRAKVWRALLITWVRISKIREEKGVIENPGGYLQKMLHAKRLENTSFRQLAMRVIAVAPEYRDAVVDATAEYQSFAEAQKLALEIEKNRKPEPVTIENNAFLKELSEKGLIPKAFDKKKKSK